MTGLVYLLAPAVAVEFLTGSVPAGVLVSTLIAIAALAWPNPPAFLTRIVLALGYFPFLLALGEVALSRFFGDPVRPLFVAVPVVIGALALWRISRLSVDPD